MASTIAPTPTRAYQSSRCKSYGQLHYTHKSSEKVFVAWVTSHSEVLQNVNGSIRLQTLEREFHRIDGRLPRNIVDELVAIVDAREKAKVIHVAQGTHDEGHENCFQMYIYFLRRANQQLLPPSVSPPPSPKLSSENDFPSLGSPSPVPSPPPPLRKLTRKGNTPSRVSPSPEPPARDNSMKRRFSAAAIDPAPANTSAPGAPSALAAGPAKKPRLVLKAAPPWKVRSAITVF